MMILFSTDLINNLKDYKLDILLIKLTLILDSINKKFVKNLLYLNIYGIRKLRNVFVISKL